MSRWAAALAGALVVVAALVLRRYEIAEESMAPALLPGDYVLTVRRPRRLRPGDVVVFDHPTRPGFTLVKRVVASGDGQVATQGDNRAASSDVGPVPSSGVAGRVLWVYWPPDRFGPPARLPSGP